jgi:hypothetical protein
MPQRAIFSLGFDRHTHVSLYGSLDGCPSVAGLDPDPAMVLLRGLPADQLNLVLGWHSARLPLTDRDLAGLPPILLVNFSLHGFRISPSAEKWLTGPDSELAERQDDPVWCERNLPRLLGFFGRLARLDEGKLTRFMEGLEAVGVGAAEDMALTGEEAWRVMRRSPWSARLRYWVTPDLLAHLPREVVDGAEGLKLFTDGALGARTAALERPFLDGTEGFLLYEDEGFRSLLDQLHSHGKAIAAHAIGHRAIEQVIAALEALGRDGVSFPAVRLEHAQFIGLGQARRARDLGLTLSMQPNFSSDSVDYVDRLPADLCAANNPFRMLIDEVGFVPGRDLIFGSDGMPHGLEYALQWSLFPAYSGQRLTLEELLAGYGGSREGGGSFSVETDEVKRRVSARSPIR